MKNPPTPKNDKKSLNIGNAKAPNSYNTRNIDKATDTTIFQTLICLLVVLFRAIPNENKAQTRIKIRSVLPKEPDI